MKIYIRAVTIKELEDKYGKEPGMTKKKFKTLINLDPTADYDTDRRGKYMPWILKQYKLGNLTEADYQNVTDTLSDLADPVRKRAYQEKDINRYETVQDLIDAHIAAQNTEVQLTDRQQARNAHRQAKEAARRRAAGEDTGDVEELVSDGTWTVYTPKTWAGAISLAMEGVDKNRQYTGYGCEDNMKATWCTAGESSDHWYRHYTSRGPLYVFINSNDPINKFQSCPAAGSWFFDKHDHEQGKRAFLNFCEEHPKIGDFFEVRTENGVQVMGTTIMGYSENSEEVIIPEGVTSIPNFPFPKACKSVILPDSVTTISDSAFKNSNVEVVTANNVTTIGKEAFAESAIIDIDLSRVEVIDNGAFRGCKNLTEVNYGPDAKLGAYAFANDTALTGPITQYATNVISSGTFNGCSNLTLIWEDEDCPYPIDGIAELVVDMATHPKLVETNQDYIEIRDM